MKSGEKFQLDSRLKTHTFTISNNDRKWRVRDVVLGMTRGLKHSDRACTLYFVNVSAVLTVLCIEG